MMFVVFYTWQASLPNQMQVLAALDVHTSRWIVEKCFCGDLIHGRTVILVVCKITVRLSCSHRCFRRTTSP